MQNRFIYSNVTYTDSNIYGGVSYDLSINTETNLAVGGAYASRIQFTTDSSTLAQVGNYIQYQKKHDNDANWVTVNYYTITEVTKENNKFKVVAYDNIMKLDQVVDSTLSSLWPTAATTKTPNEILTAICSACGVSGSSISTAWYTRNIPKCINGSNISGRSVIGWLAGYVGGCAVAINGVITIIRYTTNSTSIAEYKKFDKDELMPNIDSVWAGQISSDTGTIVGSTQNVTLRITGNPLFSIMSAGDSITAQLTLILNYVKNISYYPTSMELFSDYNIDCGKQITAKGVTTLVMSKSWNSSGVKMASTGSKVREITQTDQEVLSLAGKYSTLTNTVDEHTREIGNVQPGEDLRSLISQNAGEITLRVQKNDVINQINVSSEGATINANRINLSGVTTFVKPGDNVSTLTNDSGYQNATQVTTICGNTITTGYVNALHINAGSLTVGNQDIGSSSTKLNKLYVNNEYPGNVETFGNVDLRYNDGDTQRYRTRLTQAGVQLAYNESQTKYKSWQSILDGSGGGEPDAYIKSASVSNGVLTLTKKDDTTVTYQATFGS